MMLYAVVLLGSFSVIETIERSNKIARYAANSLKRLAGLHKPIIEVYIFAVNRGCHLNEVISMLFF